MDIVKMTVEEKMAVLRSRLGKRDYFYLTSNLKLTSILL